MNGYTRKLVVTNLAIVNQLLMAEQKESAPDINPDISMAICRIESAIDDLAKVR